MLSGMQGVTTAIIGFIFVCVIFPGVVKNRPQWYAALGGVLLIILLDGIGEIFGPERTALRTVVYFFTALLQIGGIGLLILSCGGLSPRELAEDMKRAYAVMRRGEEETEIVIPRDRPAGDGPGTVYVSDGDDPR